ncbi:Type III flagellar switch regulator (C-ring) FliN C-term [Massilia sp. PDC64]|nr:Type III flagellar switch regulator (C-ring) FliN C-term [Massilia sp. PDC64]
MARTYALLADGVLAAVRAPIEAAVAAWSRDWGVAQPSVTCRRAWDGPALPACRACLTGTGAAAWLGWPDGLRAALQGAMFASGHDRAGGAATLAAAASEAALDALQTALGAAVFGPRHDRSEDTAVPAALRAQGSGAVVVDVKFERHAVGLLLDHAAVLRFAGAPAMSAPALPPADYRALLAGQTVKLTVDAGRATVNLGSLVALAPGDVIRLDTLADHPLAARTADGAVLLRGYLGTRDQHLALDLVAGAAPSGEPA